MPELHLSTALQAWRRSRHPRLAELVRHLSVDLPRPRFGSDVPGDWVRLAESDASLQATWQLAATLELHLMEGSPWGDSAEEAIPRFQADLFRRVAHLRARCPDPRIADAALRVLTDGKLRAHHWAAAGTPLVYDPVVQLLVAAGDPGLADAVAELGHKPRSRRSLTRAYLARALPSAAEALRSITIEPLTDETEAAIRRILPRPSRASETADELWRLLVADPRDRSVRAVLADSWIELGDPRGAIVSVERSGAAVDDPALERLYKKHRDLWLGPDLDSAFVHARGRGGLLVEARLQEGRRVADTVWHAAAHDERIATLEVLHAGYCKGHHYAAFACSPLTRALRQIDVEYELEPEGPSRASSSGCATTCRVWCFRSRSSGWS